MLFKHILRTIQSNFENEPINEIQAMYQKCASVNPAFGCRNEPAESAALKEL